MEAYLISIAGVVLACGSTQYLAGDLKLKKQICFIASLCIVFSLFAPIVSWLPNAVEFLTPSFSVEDPVLPSMKYEMLLQQGERAVSAEICSQVRNKVGLQKEDMDIRIELSYDEIDNIHIEKIEVYLKRKTDGYLTKEILEYLKPLFSCEVLIYVGGVQYVE